MQTIAFFAGLLGILFAVFGVPAALYCLLGALVQRDFKPVVKVLAAVCVWVVAFILMIHVVPDGEMRASQYSGAAGVTQILFFVASTALLIFSVKTLRQQMRGSK